MSKETNGHWYTPLGEAAHFQPCKSRDGNRPTTLADAKKLGLYPSVTSILSLLRKPALEAWLIKQSVHAVVTAPDVPGESLDDKLTRVLETERQQDQESQQAMDRGTAIHAAIEEAVAGRPYPDEYRPHVEAALGQLAHLGSVVASEQILVHPSGFAGRVDCVTESNVTTIVDFKTCKQLPKKPWPEAVLQTAAYADCLNLKQSTLMVQSAVLYISTTEPGQTALFIDENWEDAFETFQYVFKTWIWLNNYNPLHWNPKET